MAGNSDLPLMVLNLLMQVDFAPIPKKHDSCCFLGARGCRFFIKPIFCLNYYCPGLKEKLGPEGLRRLETAAERVFSRQSVWEEQFLAFLRQFPELPGLAEKPE